MGSVIRKMAARLAGGSEQASEGPALAPPPPVLKQAVVIVHGMGEQRPMDTLKGFVRTVWVKAPNVADAGDPNRPNPNMVWSKPDDRTGSLELRRITTRESVPTPEWPAGARTDFYELYWADLTAGSTWQQFVSWVRYLLFRPWRRVPRDVRLAWIFLWLVSLLAIGLAAVGAVPDAQWPTPFQRWHWLLVLVAAGLGAAIHQVATRTFGRVVRYTRADPDNIAARAAVRKRGLELLRALHRGSEYSRVILVAHSLGTILAHDLLGYFWAERAAARTISAGTVEFAALIEVEAAAAELDAAAEGSKLDAARRRYRGAQTALRRLLSARPPGAGADQRWLISDFVTLGSPLTHAEFLLASSVADLHRRRREREIPTAPPFRERLDPDVYAAARLHGLPVAASAAETRLMCFPEPAHPERWVLHHAAPFAVVRWTNVHDPSRLVFWGDVIGGPLRDTLGAAIDDIDLAEVRGQARRFSHRLYWDPHQDARQLEAVRRAVNMLDA